MAEKFWGIQDQIPEPKRMFRWVMDSNLGPTWLIQEVKRPSTELSVIEVPYINHKFKYPGRYTWKAIDVSIRDNMNPDAAQTLMAIMGMAGYRFPTTELEASHTVTKQNAVNSLGQVTIKQIGLDLNNVVDEFRLKNAWVANVDFGELTYDSEELVIAKITIEYDWAEFHSLGGVTSVYPAAANEAIGNADMTEGLNKIAKIVGQSSG